MDVNLFIGFVVVLMSAAVVIGLGRRHAWRWGEVPAGTVRAGDGAYRDALVQKVRPRGVPPVVSWSAGLGYLWAALTFFVFAPSGLLLALLTAENQGEVMGIFVAVDCLSGFALAIALVIAGTSLLRCRPGAAERARLVGWWSVIHHLGVLATMAVLAVPGERGFLIVSAIPCILGLAHALSLVVAGRLPGPAVPNEPTA